MESPGLASDYCTPKSSLSPTNSITQNLNMNLEETATLKAHVAVLENELAHQHAKTEAARQATELVITVLSKKAGHLSLDSGNDSPEFVSLSDKLKVQERSCTTLRRKLAREKLNSQYLRARIKSMKNDGSTTSQCQATVKNEENGEPINVELISLAVDASNEIQTPEPETKNQVETKTASPPLNAQNIVKPATSDGIPLKYIHHFVPPGVKSESSDTACISNSVNGSLAKAADEEKVHMPISPETDSSKSSFSPRNPSKYPSNTKEFYDDHASKSQVPLICYDEEPGNFDNDERSRFAKWRNSMNHSHDMFQGRKRVDYSDISSG